MHLAYLETNISIYLAKKAQMALLLAKEIKDNKVNIMISAYTAVLRLRVCFTDVGA